MSKPANRFRSTPHQDFYADGLSAAALVALLVREEKQQLVAPRSSGISLVVITA